MQDSHVTRLIALSTLGAGDSSQHLNFFWKYIMFGMLLKKAMADHEAQEKVVKSSGLDWTIVRPSSFTDEPESGRVWHGELSTDAPLSLKVPRATIARFMVREVSDRLYLHQSPAITC